MSYFLDTIHSNITILDQTKPILKIQKTYNTMQGIITRIENSFSFKEHIKKNALEELNNTPHPKIIILVDAPTHNEYEPYRYGGTVLESSHKIKGSTVQAIDLGLINLLNMYFKNKTLTSPMETYTVYVIEALPYQSNLRSFDKTFLDKILKTFDIELLDKEQKIKKNKDIHDEINSYIWPLFFELPSIKEEFIQIMKQSFNPNTDILINAAARGDSTMVYPNMDLHAILKKLSWGPQLNPSNYFLTYHPSTCNNNKKYHWSTMNFDNSREHSTKDNAGSIISYYAFNNI